MRVVNLDFFFRQLVLAQLLVAGVLADDANGLAWVSQNLISPLGQVITYETPLHSTSGSMSSVPMNGFLARFDLYVYPLAGVDGADPEPTIVDSEIVGVLPKITMEFNGKDPHEIPRTRVDWEHTVTTTILDGPVKFSDPLSLALPGWLTRFVMRKRFLREEYIGTENSDEQWEEYNSLPVLHVSANQEITFADNAYPPNLTPGQQERWSGIIEYQLALDTVLGNPLPLLTLAKMNVRVWPKWRPDFVNIPTETVSLFPPNMRVDVADIYPGTEKVIVEYFHDPDFTGSFDGLPARNLFEEPWTATVAQDRSYSLKAMSTERDEGNYHVRVGTLLFGEMEYADDRGGLHLLPLRKTRLIMRAGLYGID